MSKQSEMKSNVINLSSLKRKCVSNDYENNFESKRAKLEEQLNDINLNTKQIESYNKPQKRITYQYTFRHTHN